MTVDAKQAATPSAAASELAAERRQWFRSFPDGTLEFIAAVRVLAIVAMFVLPIGGAALRGYCSAILGAMLLADAAMSAFWLAQLASDRRILLEGRTQRGNEAIVAAVLTLLCHAALLLAAAMLLRLPIPMLRLRPEAMKVAGWALLAAYALLGMATWYVVSRTTGTRKRAWSLLVAVPLLAWPATRRIAYETGEIFAAWTAANAASPAKLPRGGFVAADILMCLFLLAVLATARHPSTWAHMGFGPAAAALLFGLAAIADMAALEHAHHAYLKYIRTQKPKQA